MGAWLLLLVGPALAATRLVLVAAEPVDVVLDHTPAGSVSAGERRVLGTLGAGAHPLELRARPGGELVWKGEVELPDGAQVLLRLEEGGVLRLASAEGTIRPEIEVADDRPDWEAAPGAPEEPEVTSFDMNEGNAGGGARSAPREERAGNPEAFARTVSTAARVTGAAATVAAPSATAAVTVGAAAASGAVGALRTAEAGGLSAVRRGSSSGSRYRPRAKEVPAVTGTAELVAEGGPFIVYVDGEEVARFGAGGGRQRVRLEVGRRELEVWDAATLEVRWRGVLAVEEGVTVRLEFGPDRPPSAPERPWVWTGR